MFNKQKTNFVCAIIKAETAVLKVERNLVAASQIVPNAVGCFAEAFKAKMENPNAEVNVVEIAENHTEQVNNAVKEHSQRKLESYQKLNKKLINWAVS